jgi:hypothetical protein
MKHTNQDDSSRNQTAGTDQQKKANNAKGERNENVNQQHSKETRDHAGKQGNDSSQGQKDKQGIKK